MLAYANPGPFCNGLGQPYLPYHYKLLTWLDCQHIIADLNDMYEILTGGNCTLVSDKYKNLC
jgi:hypothetical protein